MKRKIFFIMLGLIFSGCALFLPKQPNFKTMDACQQYLKHRNPFEHLVLTYTKKGKNFQYIGSGAIIDKNGLIATAAHTLYEDVKTKKPLRNGIYVGVMQNGKRVGYSAKIKNVDSSFNHDIAILQIEHTFSTNAALTDSEPTPGDCVYAVGYPFVSAQATRVFGNYFGDINIIIKKYGNKTVKFYAVTAHTIPGMSGGPVYNQYGNLVGIVSNSLRKPEKDGTITDITAIAPIKDVKKILK